MSNFITEADYKVHINSEHLTEIVDDPDFTKAQILDDAEEHAIAVIKDAIVGTYDIDVIFAATATARKKNVLRWATTIVVYMLYERINDVFVPDRVVKNYNDTMDLLDEIADGKRKVDLPVLADPDTGEVVTKFKWGSRPARSH